jgi:hypothetical protein
MAQDQVSARLCPEYFTVFNPRIPGLTNPTGLGIAWGFLATWWLGLFCGYAAGLVATATRKPAPGRVPRPVLSPRDIIRPLGLLLVMVALAVALTGATVWIHCESLGVSIDPEFGRVLPPERHRALLVVSCYHFVGYVAAIGGSLALLVWIRRERARRATFPAKG